MYEPEDILVGVLKHDHSLDYDTYEDWLGDLPILEALGYITFKHPYAGGERFFIKITALQDVTFTYGSMKMRLSFTDGYTRSVSIEYNMEELIQFLKSK